MTLGDPMITLLSAVGGAAIAELRKRKGQKTLGEKGERLEKNILALAAELEQQKALREEIEHDLAQCKVEKDIAQHKANELEQETAEYQARSNESERQQETLRLHNTLLLLQNLSLKNQKDEVKAELDELGRQLEEKDQLVSQLQLSKEEGEAESNLEIETLRKEVSKVVLDLLDDHVSHAEAVERMQRLGCTLELKPSNADSTSSEAAPWWQLTTQLVLDNPERLQRLVAASLCSRARIQNGRFPTLIEPPRSLSRTSSTDKTSSAAAAAITSASETVVSSKLSTANHIVATPSKPPSSKLSFIAASADSVPAVSMDSKEEQAMHGSAKPMWSLRAPSIGGLRDEHSSEGHMLPDVLDADQSMQLSIIKKAKRAF